MSEHLAIALALIVGLAAASRAADEPEPTPLPAVKGGSLFAKPNLLAWCIVPFDAKNRGPAERVQMLLKLGITRVAYDWRAKHVPTWDEEMELYKKHGIEPKSIVKSPDEVLRATSVADAGAAPGPTPSPDVENMSNEDLIERMEKEMLEAARKLEFEKAASLRDRLEEMKGAL